MSTAGADETKMAKCSEAPHRQLWHTCRLCLEQFTLACSCRLCLRLRLRCPARPRRWPVWTHSIVNRSSREGASPGPGDGLSPVSTDGRAEGSPLTAGNHRRGRSLPGGKGLLQPEGAGDFGRIEGQGTESGRPVSDGASRAPLHLSTSGKPSLSRKAERGPGLSGSS